MASDRTDEMESLNLDDLEVSDLEARLELAIAIDPGCPQDQGCYPLCSSDYTWRC